MKQAIIVVPLFLLLLAILYLFIPAFPERKTHESFIPAEAQAVITQYDLQDRVAEFASSPLGRTLDELDYASVGRELGFSDEEIEQFFRLREEIETTYRNPLVQMLVGREISVALLPLQDGGSADFTQQLIDHLLVISRPSQSARLMDIAGWAISGDERVSTIRYGEHDITRFELENSGRLSVARVKNLVVMSLNERILRLSLDVYDNDRRGVKDNKEYAGKIAQFEGASLIGYVNFEGLPDLVNRAILESSHAQSRELDRSRIDDYSSAMFGAWRREDTIVDKAVVSFNPDVVDDSAHAQLASGNIVPVSHTRVAEDTIVYYWTNEFDPAALLGMSGNGQSTFESGEYGSLLAELAEIGGVTSAQLFDLFGRRLTLAVRSLDEDQLVPLPRFLLAANSTDVDQLRGVTERLIDHYSIPVQRKMHDNAEIISWGGIIGIGSVLPALSFFEDTVMVSSNRAQIRNYVGPRRARSLADSPIFKEMEADLLQPSLSITFLDFGRTTEMVQEMVTWGGTMLAIKDRELARRSKVLIDELINPLLEGLAMYSIVGSRKYHAGNTIVFESFTRLDNGTR